MDPDNANYKHLNGSQFMETEFLLLNPISGTMMSLLSSCLRIFNDQGKNLEQIYKSQYVIEYITIVLPVLTGYTVLSNHALLIAYMLFACFLFCYLVKRNSTNFNQVKETCLPDKRQPFITNFKALILLITSVCILAVDFHIFPRRFAKTGSFGYSLMDTGVGLFCIANAIVAPEVKIQVVSFNYVLKTVKMCTPLLILGYLRYFATSTIEYHVDSEEYGLHWNFFLTLAFTRIISVALLFALRVHHPIILSVALIVMYQCLLGAGGIEEWVLSSIPRDNFLAANREGISSLMGYISLYMAGISLGQYIQSMERKFCTQTPYIIKFILLWFVLIISTGLCESCFGISRRLANIGYYLWILSYALLALALLLSVQLGIHFLHIALRKEEGNSPNRILYTPLIFEAINFNGLFFFLISNILTGIINISLNTFDCNHYLSFLILIVYVHIICKISVELYRRNIRLKVW